MENGSCDMSMCISTAQARAKRVSWSYRRHWSCKFPHKMVLVPSSTYAASINQWFAAAKEARDMEWTNNDWNYLPLQAQILVKTYLNPRDFTTLEATTWGENTKSKQRCLGLFQRCKIPGPMELLRILHLGFAFRDYIGYKNPLAPWNYYAYFI